MWSRKQRKPAQSAIGPVGRSSKIKAGTTTVYVIVGNDGRALTGSFQNGALRYSWTDNAELAWTVFD
jgi:hypothetical protein